MALEATQYDSTPGVITGNATIGLWEVWDLVALLEADEEGVEKGGVMIIERDQLRKAKETAEAVLRGDVPILEAARTLTRALIDTRLTRSAPALLFNGISSETEDLPIGRVREHWAAAPLIEKDRQAAAYEAMIRDNSK